MLGLPQHIRACLFDLDGVLTDTAAVHAQAWKQMFDEYLAHIGQPPFDPVKDYGLYVDGKKREDGTRAFLASRDIDAPEETVQKLSARKNELVLQLIEEQGVKVFPGSVRYLREACEAGLKTAVVSSSANTAQVLKVTDLDDLFAARIDGVTAKERGIPGKPAPDMFLEGARAVGVPVADCAVFEDALAGAEAGRAGDFGIVIGVDRVRDGFHGPALLERGADLVVTDLSELLEK